MMTSTKATFNINMEKYRLRRFVERLVDMDEVEIHDEPVPLTGLGTIIEKTEKAVLFKRVGPEKKSGNGGEDRGQPKAPDRRVRNH
jgi:hypothetical protein